MTYLYVGSHEISNTSTPYYVVVLAKGNGRSSKTHSEHDCEANMRLPVRQTEGPKKAEWDKDKNYVSYYIG